MSTTNSYFYDLEIYPNYFELGFCPTTIDKLVIDEYIKADLKNDKYTMNNIVSKHFKLISIKKGTKVNLNIIRDFIKNIKCLVGYNNRNYDDNILDYFLHCKIDDSDILVDKVYELSNAIIDFGRINKFNYRNNIPELKYKKSHYISIDIQKIMYFDVKYISLKQLGIQLKWYKTQSLPYLDEELSDTQIKEVLEYNVNDLLITREAFFNKTIHEEVRNRLTVSELYKDDFLAHSRSSMANKMLTLDYELESGKRSIEFTNLRTIRRSIDFNEIIHESIEFKSDKLKDFLFTIKQTKFIVGQSKFKYTTRIGNNIYTIGLGGLHSQDRPDQFMSNDKYTLVDVDFGSWYPKLILNFKVCPKHLDPVIFFKIFNRYVKLRLDYKHVGNKKLAEIYKIVINAIYGKFKDMFSWLYDPKATYATTLNGQLLLLMLIELNEDNGFKAISCNTDGITFKVPNNRLKEHEKLCNDFATKHNHELEFNYYLLYVRHSVNNYIAVKYDGSIKKKGYFLNEIALDKGYKHPITPIIWEKYFVEGKSVDDILTNHKDIYDFCISQKTGNQFINQYRYLDLTDNELVTINLPKNIRYFVSKTGGVLVKKYKDSNKTVSILANKYVTIFNQYYEADIKDYNIEYGYYKKEAMQLINEVLHLDTKLIKGSKSKSGISGTMFDEIE